MLSHLITTSARPGVFTALIGSLVCASIAFTYRRNDASRPRWLVLAYRITWLATAIAWIVQGVAPIFGLNHGPIGLALAPTAALVAGATLGLYFTIQMRGWPFENR